jgi:predicted nucleotidyltransferase component of viral defense system
MEHNMRLHEDKDVFSDAIAATAQYKKLRQIYIEKDYWVTVALHSIFTNEIGRQAVFKGGTALSKCFQIIERFSEDIDIVVLRSDEDSDSQLNKKIRKIGACVENVLPEIEIEGITHKRGMNRKTAHSYVKNYEGDFGQVRDKIILEATWLGHFEPYTTSTVQSYIAEMMINQNQVALIKEYNLEAFPVRVLTKQRTFCEKIMSLVRFSYDEVPISALKNKIRHIYDIYKLLQDKETKQFFVSDEFEKLLLKVANDDVKSFRNNNEWLSNHPIKAMIFEDIENTWAQLRQTYNSDFKELLLGELPSEKDIINTLFTVSERMKPIQWTIGSENLVDKLLVLNTQELSELIVEIKDRL